MATMSSAQIVSASVLHNKTLAAAGVPGFAGQNEGPNYAPVSCFFVKGIKN